MLDCENTRVPVTVLPGFLGAGKTPGSTTPKLWTELKDPFRAWVPASA